jgi:hypothetical protein
VYLIKTELNASAVIGSHEPVCLSKQIHGGKSEHASQTVNEMLQDSIYGEGLDGKAQPKKRKATDDAPIDWQVGTTSLGFILCQIQEKQ